MLVLSHVTHFLSLFRCGHCQRLAPEYAKAATALKGLAKMAAVDMTKHQELGGPYNVQGFPTIKVFGANKKSPSDYQGEAAEWRGRRAHMDSLILDSLPPPWTGPRTAQGLVDAAVKEVQKVASARLSGRAGSNSGNSGSGSSGGGNRSGGSVIELTDATFKSQVLGSSDVWLVAFIAPWW